MNNQAMLEITSFQLADYLMKMGHPDKGSAILKERIVKDPKAVSPRCVIALARFAYDCKSWDDAATLWRLVVSADSTDIEAWIKLGCSSLELDRKTDAESCASTARSLIEHQGRNGQSVDCEEWLKGAYEQICLHFLRDDFSKADELLRMFALPGTYIGNLLRGENNGCSGRSLRDDKIEKRLDDAFREWEAGGRTAPYLEQHRALGHPSTNVGSLPKKRVLLVFRQYFLGRADSREHEVTVFFRASAQAVGFETLFIPAEPFLNPTAVKPEQQYSELDKLAQTILSWKPDLVIFDDLCNQQAGGEYIGPQVYKDVFCSLMSQQPFKLVGFYMDSWTPTSLSAIAYVSSFIDVVWHLSFYPSKSDTRTSQAKMFGAPIPYPEALFQVGNFGKDINAAFVGSLFEYNLPRAVWLTLIKARKIPCQLFLSTHTMTGSQAGATPEEYASFMSRLRISVNFCARDPSHKIMTGRAWESIISRSLLLEEDNEDIKRFFVPFVHYIPFKTIGELEAYISFFQRNENLRRAIAERAFEWFREVFSKERIWSDLIATAFN